MEENLVRKVVAPVVEGSEVTSAEATYYIDTRGDAWLTVEDANKANEARKKRNQFILFGGVALAAFIAYKAVK